MEFLAYKVSVSCERESVYSLFGQYNQFCSPNPVIIDNYQRGIVLLHVAIPSHKTDDRSDCQSHAGSDPESRPGDRSD